MNWRRRKREQEADHQRVRHELRRKDREIVEMAARLVMLEAEVGIFRAPPK